MANHGYVTVRDGRLDPEAVNRDLQEIVERRFLGKLEIDYSPSDGWLLHPKGLPDFDDQIEFWIAGRRLVFRHPFTQWCWWAQVGVLQEEFAYRYGGTISDDGLDGRWKGSLGRLKRYPTFRSWTRASGLIQSWLERKSLPGVLLELDEELGKRAKDGTLWPANAGLPPREG
jgi:hypothetical protein